jgi:Phosphotransferase enzyme family
MEVAGHPAARAWQRLRLGRLPVSIDVVRFPNWKRSHTVIYRLGGCAPGEHDVIAKCCRASKLQVERRVYLQILGPLGIDLPHCYGYVADPEGISGWLFLEEVSGVQYSESEPHHRFLASCWLGKMHAATSGIAPSAVESFPRVTLDRYWSDIDSALKSISRDYLYADLNDADRLALRSAEHLLERLAKRRSSVDDLWRMAPHCLVHGDFFGKNAVVDERGADPGIRVLDWGSSGWGVPMDDLAELDMAVYGAHAPVLWRDFGEERLLRLARIGSALRAVACLEAYVAVVADRFSHVVDDIVHYSTRLQAIEDQLGW